MCGLKKCCVNCKYYEHIRELDNEVDWCHYPNHEGIISNDPEYVKSELSGDCEQYEQITSKPQHVPTRIKPDTWYKVDNDSREMFIEDLYAAYLNLCDDKKIPSMILKSFKEEYPQLNKAECFRLNSAIVMVNYRSNYNDKYMQDVIDYKQLIKEINEKIARKIMNNSVYGMAAMGDPICAEPSIVKSASSSLYPFSSEITVPPVRIAISSNISFLLSPNPGALTATIFKEPLRRFTTSVANASPSMSSEMISKPLPV